MATVEERLLEVDERLDNAVQSPDVASAVGELVVAPAQLAEAVREQQKQIARQEEWSVERYNRADRHQRDD